MPINPQNQLRSIYFVLIFSVVPFQSTAEDFTNAIRAFLQQRVEVEKQSVGLVVGIVDEHGSSVVSCGILDNGNDREVDGDTLFEIGSITKTFTALLLQDMIERGEMKLDDPVAKYLPPSVKMPTCNGKQITLLHLATHTSGLPRDPENLGSKIAGNPYSDYSTEKLYPFLSGYKLTREPGAKYEYSNLGMGLLGHVITLKAGTNYESLVMERICRPLNMDSTRITMPLELKARFARGHVRAGQAATNFDFELQNPLASAGALRSTANDMLKYVSANLSLKPSNLTPLMEKTHAGHLHQTADVDIGLAWMISHDLQGAKVVYHGGTTSGYYTFVAFDEARRRGVVVLCNARDEVGFSLGKVLLESEWQSNRPPREIKLSSAALDSCVGQYRLSPSIALGMLIMRLLLANAPKALVCIPAGVGAATLFLLLWRARSKRQRWIILGCTAFAGGFLAILSTVISSRVFCSFFDPAIGIRREADRVFASCTVSPSGADFALHALPFVGFQSPAITLELSPESDSCFFERISHIPLTFSRDDRGKVTRLTAHIPGGDFSFKKISDQPVVRPPKSGEVLHRN